MLDASTLVISTIDGIPVGPAKMMHSMGAHLVEDLAYRFGADSRAEVWVERQEFDDARSRLARAGLSLREADDSWQRFSRMRMEYASRLNDMALLWATPPAQWVGDRSTIGHRHGRQEPTRTEAPAEAGASPRA